MIVPAMNPEEILKEVILDFDTVERKAYYLGTHLRRKLIKAKNNTICEITDYKSLRKNDWVILIICTHKGLCTITGIHYLNPMGFNAINVYNREKIVHYSSHFLERYNERYVKLKDMTKLDLFKNFVSHNTMIVHQIIDPQDFEIRRIVGRFKQGVGFGTIEEINNVQVTNYKTFVTNEMLFESQKDKVKTMEEYYQSVLNKDMAFKRIANF